MPWTTKDAKQKNSAIKGDKEARMWMKVANSTLKRLLANGVKQNDAEARAIRAANSAVAEMHKKGGNAKEGVSPVCDGLECLQEFVDSRGLQLQADPEAGVINGVKILGPESRNGRIYPKETIARAVPLYENIKVNVNHTPGGTGPRDYQDRIGQLRNVRVSQGDNGLFADLHYNPKHALAEQLAWDAKHAPENVGFSHNVAVRVSHQPPGNLVVEEIKSVRSVDLVADPATTHGLFEQEAGSQSDEQEIDMETLTVEKLQAERPDLVEAIGAEALAADDTTKQIAERDQRVKALGEELDVYKAKEALATKQAAVEQEITEAKLPDEVVTDVFRESLMAAEDAAARSRLIEDRQQLAKLKDMRKPQSQEQHLGDLPPKEITNDEFVEAVTE